MNSFAMRALSKSVNCFLGHPVDPKKKSWKHMEKYIEFKDKHNKEMREVKKLQIDQGTKMMKQQKSGENSAEVNFFFYPNSAIQPNHLKEDANLVDIKS